MPSRMFGMLRDETIFEIVDWGMGDFAAVDLSGRDYDAILEQLGSGNLVASDEPTQLLALFETQLVDGERHIVHLGRFVQGVKLVPKAGEVSSQTSRSRRASASLKVQTGIGVDGWAGGWFWVSIAGKGYRFGICEAISGLETLVSQSDAICVDIPIGLTDDPAGRACDRLARQMLSKRASSVFSAPARGLLECTDYRKANDRSRRLIGKGISKQAFCILPKVAEVDAWLRANEGVAARVIEGHPEVCFLGLAGAPMRHSKRSTAGYDERRAVLATVWPSASKCIDEALDRYPRKALARDDIVDAIVLALVAATPNLRTTIPEDPAVDDLGLPMAIHYSRIAPKC